MDNPSQPGSVVPERYLAALGKDDPLTAMKAAAGRIAKAIRGLSEKTMSQRPAPGKWSIKEVVSHLADGEVILGSRIRLIAAHDNPPIQAYDQDLFVARLGIDRAKTEDLLEDYAAVRRANLHLLKRLPKESWSRTGIHQERGLESIATLVSMYAGHDRIHEEQITTRALALTPKPAAKKKPARNPKKTAKKTNPARPKAKKTAKRA